MTVADLINIIRANINTDSDAARRSVEQAQSRCAIEFAWPGRDRRAPLQWRSQGGAGHRVRRPARNRSGAERGLPLLVVPGPDAAGGLQEAGAVSSIRS